MVEMEKGTEIKKEKSYILRYNHKPVIITLLNGEKIKGKLHTDLYNKFDVLVEVKQGKKNLIPKHSILFIELEGDG